jgi:hypothetical protein
MQQTFARPPKNLTFQQFLKQKCTSSATAEDDDDVTVQTSNSNSTKQAWMIVNIAC